METTTRTTDTGHDARVSASLAAFDAAQAQLAKTSTTDLLRAAYALTHRIHETISAERDRSYRDLRAQRDMIEAEIIRRADRPTLSVVSG